MEGYLLQDWTTIRAAATTTFVAQSELGWLDLLDYRDAIFWLEVKARNVGGGTDLFMRYETAPSKDEALFLLMTPAFRMTASALPDVKKVIEATNPSVPVCRWVRWRMEAEAPVSEWSATFRIHCAANRGGLR